MPERILPLSPEFAASSIEEVLSLAFSLERQAAARYELFARCMRQVGHANLASMFDALCAEEKRHVESVERLSENLLSRPAAAEVIDWIVPETFSSEEAGSPSQLMVYDVLAIAIRSEERAFSFWTYVAATATSEPVRAQAESMARQELVHAAKLRHERHIAYRSLAQPPVPPQVDADAALDTPAVWREARRLEAQAADYLASAAAQLLRLEDEESATLLQTIAENMRLIVPAQVAKGVAPSDEDLIQRSTDAAAATGCPGLLFEAAGVIDRLVDRYARMLGISPNATVTAEIDKFASPAVKHLAQINGRLYTIEPSLRDMGTASPGPQLAVQPKSDLGPGA